MTDAAFDPLFADHKTCEIQGKTGAEIRRQQAADESLFLYIDMK